MFDLGNGCGPGISADPSDERPARRQYTLKGVEADTINLMRHAANKEGMKIGSWVSLRMKEAAERALSSDSITTSTPDIHSINPPISMTQGDTLEKLIVFLNSQLDSSNARITRLEREIHELTSVQRSILSALLRDKSPN